MVAPVLTNCWVLPKAEPYVLLTDVTRCLLLNQVYKTVENIVYNIQSYYLDLTWKSKISKIMETIWKLVVWSLQLTWTTVYFYLVIMVIKIRSFDLKEDSAAEIRR